MFSHRFNHRQTTALSLFPGCACLTCFLCNFHPLSLTQLLSLSLFPFDLIVVSYRIYQAGYPICHDFNQFVERFLILLQGVHPHEITEYREVSYQICTEVLHTKTGWQMGQNKVFLKVGLLYKLIFRALNKNTVVP